MQAVFTELVERLGVKNVQVDELYSVDSESLRGVEPVHAVIFLFKYSAMDQTSARRRQPLSGTYDLEYLDKGIFFARQTIGNACATQAVLNALLNSDVDVGAELGNLRAFSAGFDLEMCGHTIGNSDRIRSIHNSFSAPRFVEGDSDAGGSDDVFHFVAYVPLHGAIYEFDGLHLYPIRHEGADFCAHLPDVLQRRIAMYGGEVRFSLLAVTNDKLAEAERSGDAERAEWERKKRETWRRDNAMRRHDFPKFIVALLRNVSKNLSNDEWAQLLDDARGRARSRARLP